jgi:DNA-binding beta-propeller fold protein YncE
MGPIRTFIFGIPIVRMFPCKCRRAKSAVVAALFIAAVSSTLTARGQITYVKTIGGLSSGTAAGQFNDPYGLTVSPAGQVFVADFLNNRVQVFNTNLGYQASITTWSGGSGQFNGPADVAVNARIEVFDSSGGYVTAFGSSGSGAGQFQDPYGVAVSPTGEIFVAD